MYKMYLGSYEVTNSEGKRQHEHFHAVTCHLFTLLAINVNVMEVGRILRGQGDHRGVGHDSCKAVCQSFPHCLKTGNRKEWLSFRVNKIFTPQNLCITEQHRRHNMVSKQAEIPDKNLFNRVHTRMYLVCTLHRHVYTMYIHQQTCICIVCTVHRQEITYVYCVLIITDATRPWDST